MIVLIVKMKQIVAMVLMMEVIPEAMMAMIAISLIVKAKKLVVMKIG